MNQHPVKTAVVGCGKISDIYFQNMIEKYETLEVVACCARGMESAVRQGTRYGVKPCTFEEILADRDVEMLVILTPRGGDRASSTGDGARSVSRRCS